MLSTAEDQPAPPRVALVSGASYGVGAATAMALAGRGFRVAVTATQSRNLDTIVARLANMDCDALPIELDLRSQESIQSAVARVHDRFGRLDVLVNNAGANLRRLAIETSPREWDDLMATNVTGTFFLTQQVGKRLIERRAPGCVVTIASTHAFVGAAERSAYGISKAALVQMTRMLAIEWAEHGITVNAVAPGRLDTASPSRTQTGSDSAYMETMLKKIPLHRLATAEEVAETVVFLVGPAARSVTGQTIVLDGGLTTA